MVIAMLRRLIGVSFVWLALIALMPSADAQGLQRLCFPTATGNCQQVTATNPYPVTGSFSASIAGFNWESAVTPLAVSTSSATSGSFTAGKVVLLTNVGTTNTAYCKLGATATTSHTPILPGQSVAFTSVAETTVACITSTSTTTVNIQVGTGLPTGWGGSGSGGGGGAVTIADGADVNAGAIADAAVSAGASGTISAKLRAISRDVAAAIPAGTNIIGKVGIDQTTPGTTNAVAIDQSTSGTTNRVTIGADAAGGCTPAKVLSAASTNATSVKGSAGTLCKLTVINTTSTLYYLKFYNTSSAPTCNSDTVLATYPVPASTSGAGVVVNLGPFGEAYSTGIGFCLTGGLADNDNTNAATGVVISYSYK